MDKVSILFSSWIFAVFALQSPSVFAAPPTPEKLDGIDVVDSGHVQSASEGGAALLVDTRGKKGFVSLN